MRRWVFTEALGIYRMRLDSKLADKAPRIETEISFTASPEWGHELWLRAEQVLANLPQRITADDVEQQSQQFIRVEQGHSNDFTTQQRRLILSDLHYDDPRYLSEVSNFAQAVTLDWVRAMASKLLNPVNRVLLLSLPREGAETADSATDGNVTLAFYEHPMNALWELCRPRRGGTVGVVAAGRSVSMGFGISYLNVQINEWS
ncbi:MAG: hypothetical protein ACR5LF_12510 [Symbiopectobacterium sp.]